MKEHNKVPVDSHGNGNNGEATKSVRKRGKHDANLQKRGLLHFQIGLILAMLLVYIGLEASFRAQKDYAPEVDPLAKDHVVYESDLPKIKVEKPKKQVIQKRTTKFTPVDNDADIEEGSDVIEVPDNSPDESGLDASDIEFVEPDIPEEIPFPIIEDAPIFPGCENVKKSERLSCFQEKIQKHIKKNFRYPELAKELGQQGRVSVIFKINTDGSISDIQMRGPSDILEKEAERIILKLPQMTPGKQRGTPVRVPFSIPINFVLND